MCITDFEKDNILEILASTVLLPTEKNNYLIKEVFFLR